MKRFVLGALAMVAGASCWGHPVAEYAHVAEDVVAIAGDVRGILEDVAASEGVHAASTHLVDAWGALRSAAGASRCSGGAAQAIKDIEAGAGALSAAYEALVSDESLADAASRARDIVVRLVDLLHVVRGGDQAVSAVGRRVPDLSALTTDSQSLQTTLQRFEACYAGGEPYLHPQSCGYHDWVGQASQDFGVWTNAALAVISASGGATVSLGESCQSRCHHECHGSGSQARCIWACGTGCAPHLCGNCT